jgi:hypothetical protein
VIPTTTPTPSDQPEEDTTHHTTADNERLYEYHMNRVLSGFTFVISAENAELLAGLLTDDNSDPHDAHEAT